MPSLPNRPTQVVSLARRLLPGAITVAALIPVTALLLGHDRLLADDAYITFRYARNLAAGHSLVYNLGEPVLGTSTPLFVLLLAAGARLGLDLPTLSVWLGALSWGGVVLLLARLWRNDPAWSFAPLLLVGTSVAFGDNLGMEAPLYALVCLAALLLAGSGRTIAAAFLAGVASVTRLDGGLVAAVLLLWLLARRRRLPWRETLVVLAVAAPWYAYAWNAYGSPLPQSLQAKAGLAHSLGFGGGDFVQGGWLLLRARLTAWPALAALLTAAVVGLAHRPQAERGGLYVLWGLVYIAAYWASGMPHFGWYYVPLVPWVALLSHAGLCRLTSAGRAARLLAMFLAACLALAAGQMAAHSWQQRSASAPRAVAYREVGEWLAAHAQPDDRVALLEIGVAGYYSDLTVVDTMGLVSPYLGERLLDWGQSLVLALQHYWPEYALSVATTAWEAVEREEWFGLSYQLVAEFDHAAEGDPAARLRLFALSPGYPPPAQTPLSLTAHDGFFARLEEAALHGPPLLTPGAPLHLALTWRCLSAPPDDMTVTVMLEGSTGPARTLLSAEPLRGSLPTTLWRLGEATHETVSLVLPADVPAGPARLIVTLGERELAGGAVVVSPTEADVGAHLTTLEEVPFEGGPTLLGWRVEQTDDQVSVSVAWRAEDVPPEDWSIFVHLADAEERPLAQFDGYPFSGRRPTSSWQPGQVYVDTYSLPLPDDLAAGRYRLLLGVYDWRTGDRLKPLSPRARPSHALLIEELAVAGPADQQ